MEGPVFHKRNFITKTFSFTWLSKTTITEIISHLFIILFLYTGISKLMDISVFKVKLAESPVLAPMSSIIAWGLPLSEFIVSILLFIPKYRLIGLYASFLLMVVFTGYVIVILTFSEELPCTCGGILEQLSWQQHLAVNGAFIALAIIGIRLDRRLKRNKR